MIISNDNDLELATRLRLAVTRMARRLRQHSDHELSPSLTAALSTIERLGPLTPSALAEAERIQRPTATRIAARLAEAELVERAVDERDRRVARLAITAEGRRTLKAIRSRKTAYLARRIERLDPADRELLARATDVLERMLDEDA